MLEKPGACIPLDTIFEGPRTSPFSVFAVAQCQVTPRWDPTPRATLRWDPTLTPRRDPTLTAAAHRGP